MSSPQYFDFLRNVWKNLSGPDRDRMAELWKGFEQCVAAIYQKWVEASAGVSVKNIFTYSDERWLPYTFSSSNRVIRAATYTTSQDLSLGVNLSLKHIIKFSWDDTAPIELSLKGEIPGSTKISEIAHRINVSAGFPLVKILEGALLVFTSPTVGINSKIRFYSATNAAEDASEVVLGVGLAEMPFVYPELPYYYSSPYPMLASVPEFRNSVRDESVTGTLIEGTDYIISNGEFSFREIPSESLWSKRNLFNEEWPWNNFGFLMDIYQANSKRYVQVIQGLWFAFWTGPKPENLRRAIYLLFELPTAPFDGTVIESTPTLIRVSSDAGVVVSYDVPDGLDPLVVVGERVELFQPLVSGIDVFDKVNYPGFIRTEIDRVGIQRFLTPSATRGPGDTDETKALTMLEEYTFLPQISVNAFVKPDINIGNIRLFLDAIKPVIKTYLFQVIIGTFRDELALNDWVSSDVDMDVTPSVDSNETTFQTEDTMRAHEISPMSGLGVDTEGVCFQEITEVEVRSFGTLIDSFEV
jgi:hypothetical protein